MSCTRSSTCHTDAQNSVRPKLRLVVRTVQIIQKTINHFLVCIDLEPALYQGRTNDQFNVRNCFPNTFVTVC